MEILAIIKIVLLVASLFTFIFSLIFLFLPDLYLRMEALLNKDVIQSVEMVTALEGKIDFVNDWLFENRVISGTLFVLLSLYNIKSLFFLY